MTQAAGAVSRAVISPVSALTFLLQFTFNLSAFHELKVHVSDHRPQAVSQPLDLAQTLWTAA